MWFFIVELAAVGLTIIQIALLPRLFFPFSDLCLPVAAITLSILRDRPLTAALWALTAGFVLDLYGLLGFGTEMGALFAVFLVERFVFRRFLTNASAAAVVLLTAIGVLTRFAFRLGIDGLDVLTGGVPVILGTETAAWTGLAAAIIANGALVLAVRGMIVLAVRRYQRAFLPHAVTR